MKTRIKEIGSVIGACGLLLIVTVGCGSTYVRSESLPGTNKAIVQCRRSYDCVSMAYELCARVNGQPEIFSQDPRGHWMIYNCKLNK